MIASLIPFAVTTLDHAALALVIGTAACWLYLLAARRGAAFLRSVALLPLLWLALAMLAVSSTGDLVVRTAALADIGLSEARPYIGRALTQSDYGLFWQIRAAAWLALTALALAIWRRGSTTVHEWGTAAAAAVLVFTTSSTGHAAAEGSLTLPNLVNCLHILAGCLWGGTVVVYAVRVLPRLARGNAPARAIALAATRLSILAGTALALVLVTGVYNALRQFPDWPSLWESDYGHALLFKLTAVAVMMAIGAGNRFFVVPAVEAWAERTANASGDDAPVRRFLRRLRIDSAVFVVILAAAAVLSDQIPPIHLTADEAMNMPATIARTVRA